MAKGDWLMLLLALLGAKKKAAAPVDEHPPLNFPFPAPQPEPAPTAPPEPKPPTPAPTPAPAPSTTTTTTTTTAPASPFAVHNEDIPRGYVRAAVTHAPSDVATWVLAVQKANVLDTWQWTKHPTRNYLLRAEPQSISTSNVLILYGLMASSGTPSGKGRGGT